MIFLLEQEIKDPNSVFLTSWLFRVSVWGGRHVRGQGGDWKEVRNSAESSF